MRVRSVLQLTTRRYEYENIKIRFLVGSHPNRGGGQKPKLYADYYLLFIFKQEVSPKPRWRASRDESTSRTRQDRRRWRRRRLTTIKSFGLAPVSEWRSVNRVSSLSADLAPSPRTGWWCRPPVGKTCRPTVAVAVWTTSAGRRPRSTCCSGPATGWPATTTTKKAADGVVLLQRRPRTVRATCGSASAFATGRPRVKDAAAVWTTGWWTGSGGTATVGGWASPCRPPNGCAAAASLALPVACLQSNA